jgi:RNA polymerase sigma-70 factor (ECF subfamily)
MMQSSGWSDETLLERARRGSEDAFTALYRRHSGKLYRFALALGVPPPVAEEAVQEVFLAFVEGRAGYDGRKGTPLPFLLGMTRNTALAALRRERGYAPLERGEPETAADALGRMVERESVETLWQAVRSLPPAYREVVVLCELEELDYAQAAQALGCPIGTVRSRLSRARRLLIGKMQARMPV